MQIILVVLIVVLIVGGFFVWLIGRKKSIVLGLEDNGRTVDVDVGEVVTIKLETPSGFQWRYVVDEDIVKVTQKIGIPGESNMPGAGSIYILMLKVIRNGEAKIFMECLRPWGEGSAIRRFSIILRTK
jgi:predicted secreted protein